MKRLSKKQQSNGFILASLLITTFMISSIAVSVLSLSVSNNQQAQKESARVNAQFTADAALDKGIQELNKSSTYTGTAETTFYQDSKLKTTYQIAVIDGAVTTKKTIKATARVYSPVTAATPSVTRIYDLDVQAVTTGNGPSSVVTGVGGLILNNNSRITGGDVVVNGTVTVNNNAQIGLSTTPLANAVNVRVAHTNCPNPADSNYPRVCAANENGQPIFVDTNGRIYADVRATNQTNGTRMSNPGLIANQTVAPVSLPDYDRDAQKSAVSTTITGSSAGCSGGSKTWAANTKITGNVTVQNNCTVTLNGNVWITGALDINNNAKIVVANSLGTTRPTIMVDGAGSSGSDIAKIGNNGIVQPNSTGTGALIITYWSSKGCSPDCSDVTGTDLFTSKDVRTLELSNNGAASNTILFARWSKVRISNNGAIGAVAGQTIELGNNAVINFTASVPGSSNLTVTWVKRGYLRVYN